MEPSDPKFSHPFQPYDIQLQFMQNLYSCIENGSVGIFESPTGTGKSLSLICGGVTWLRDHERRTLEDKIDEKFTGDMSDWLVQAERQAHRRELLRDREELEQRLETIRRKNKPKVQIQSRPPPQKKTRLDDCLGGSRIDDTEFLLEDYDSDNESKATSNTTLSSATQALLEKLKPTASSSEEVAGHNRVKLIFCSRTHSQLTQFVNELRRVEAPHTVLQANEDNNTVHGVAEVVKHLPLGSRRNLCINPRVSRLANNTAINERCLELQKPDASKQHKCEFLPAKDDQGRLMAFTDRTIATIQDIEDVADLGRRMKLCPYYASRTAIPSSEVVTLPYPLLLQKSAREALGLSVKDNVVIIDEAHNLMDAIADTLSVSLSMSNLQLVTSQLVAYVQRFKNKLKGKNRVYITQLIRLLNSFTNFLRDSLKEKQETEKVVSAAQLMSGPGADQVRPHDLLRYLHGSKLSHKVDGYAKSTESESISKSPTGLLMHVQNFLAVLMNPDAEGRFFVVRQDDDVLVRYTLLDPREHFRDIVEEARAIILAGGTMSPMSDYADYLFSYLEPDKLKMFSFGHVIPKESLLVEAVARGPTGIEFDFTFTRRSSEPMMLELGRLVNLTCGCIPDGVVVFFPSYDYLAQVVAVWKRSPNGRSIMDMLATRKQIFEEVKGVSVEDLLREYTQAIDTGKGGLMLSVVGGKLSEGINFSDKLGRAVVAVGLPFPNANGAEWKAKIEHVEQTRFKQCQLEGKGKELEWRAKAKAAGMDFYENACMRAVNQSIGRVIRHQKDYAAILLIDRRFATERIKKKLPNWIKSSISEQHDWVLIERDLNGFFSHKT